MLEARNRIHITNFRHGCGFYQYYSGATHAFSRKFAQLARPARAEQKRHVTRARRGGGGVNGVSSGVGVGVSGVTIPLVVASHGGANFLPRIFCLNFFRPRHCRNEVGFLIWVRIPTPPPRLLPSPQNWHKFNQNLNISPGMAFPHKGMFRP
jgi:hypothetical protein